MSFSDNDYWDKKWKLFDVYYVYKVPRKKMKIKILLVLFLSTASAQTLSVDEAVRIALENKSAITNAEKDVRIAQLSRNSSAALSWALRRSTPWFSSCLDYAFPLAAWPWPSCRSRLASSPSTFNSSLV